MIDEIAAERLGGSVRTEPDAFNREFDIYRRLKPHTRRRPKEENQWRLDRENRGPVRSNNAARTAAKILAEALDQYQSEQYGRNENGTPHGPPPAEHFPALTTKGQRDKRHEHIEETMERWRNGVAPNLLQQIRQAIVALEVEFRRQLARERKAARHAAKAQRGQVHSQHRAAPSKPPGRDRD